MQGPAARWKTAVTGVVTLMATAGCDSRSSESPAPFAIVTAAPHAASIVVPTPRPTTAIATPSPTPSPNKLADMRPRKTFVDPPLPPELLDDGGLRPLPPTR